MRRLNLRCFSGTRSSDINQMATTTRYRYRLEKRDAQEGQPTDDDAILIGVVKVTGRLQKAGPVAVCAVAVAELTEPAPDEHQRLIGLSPREPQARELVELPG